MICEVCGSEIPVGCSACPICGTPVPQQAEPVAAEPVAAPQPQYQAAPQSNTQPLNTNKGTNTFGLIGFILCIVGVSMLVGFILSIIGVVKRKEYSSGNGFAIAGLVISALYLFLLIIIVAVVIGGAAATTAPYLAI